jgi:hypothetical protein
LSQKFAGKLLGIPENAPPHADAATTGRDTKRAPRGTPFRLPTLAQQTQYDAQHYDLRDTTYATKTYATPPEFHRADQRRDGLKKRSPARHKNMPESVLPERGSST